MDPGALDLDLSPLELAGRAALTIALALFIGMSFEDTYKQSHRHIPGGIRTFPMLALGGLALYLAEPTYGFAFIAGLIGLAVWLGIYIHRNAGEPTGALSLMVPATNLLVYALPPLALRQPSWLVIGLSVGAVLLLGERMSMRRLARAVSREELITAGKFLILAGVIFPLLPREPVVSWVPVSPYSTWLAVLAVSGLSYLGYLLQRYIPHKGNTLIQAILGGAYSSTATTVVLARRQKELRTASAEIAAGIVAATTMMYVRVTIIVFLFSPSLGGIMAPYLAAPIVLGTILVASEWSRARTQPHHALQKLEPTGNPLALGTAAVFAVFFVVISVLAEWVTSHHGNAGILVLAVVTGFADIDPFVLNLVQGGTSHLAANMTGAAILLAIASNNILKASYALGFGGPNCRRATFILGILAASSLAGVTLLFWR